MVDMPVTKRSKQVRRSVSLSADIDSKVQKIARREKRSANHVLERLIEKGVAAEEAERQRFYELLERFRDTNDPKEKQRLGDEVGRAVFGE